jgi:hypothetical protein
MFGNQVFGQKNGYFGLGINYNAAVKEPGLELRYEYFLDSKLVLVPHISYFPGINNIRELYVGANMNYYPFEKKQSLDRISFSKIKPYLFAGMAYNNWSNYNPLSQSKLNIHNYIPQTGLGMNFGGIGYRMFTEFNYNIRANESGIKLGVLFSPSLNKLKRKNQCPN